MASLSPPPKLQFFGTDGLPLVGGKLYTYAAGTTTPLATYTDSTQSAQNTNPVILDSNGQANVWLTYTTNYKYVLKTSADVSLYTVDYVGVPVTTSEFASPPPIGNATPNSGTFTTLTATGQVTFLDTGAAVINVGTTAQRPAAPQIGMIRYNSSTGKYEGYSTDWGQLGGGATGGGGDQVFIQNGQTVTTDYTITTNYNAGTFGPVSINSGVTVTIPTGSVWTVI
jgi:hypothetical protein